VASFWLAATGTDVRPKFNVNVVVAENLAPAAGLARSILHAAISPTLLTLTIRFPSPMAWSQPVSASLPSGSPKACRWLTQRARAKASP